MQFTAENVKKKFFLSYLLLFLYFFVLLRFWGVSCFVAVVQHRLVFIKMGMRACDFLFELNEQCLIAHSTQLNTPSFAIFLINFK